MSVMASCDVDEYYSTSLNISEYESESGRCQIKGVAFTMW